MTDPDLAYPPSVLRWEALAMELGYPAGIPDHRFILRWIWKESNGNRCAIGEPGATGPDGHPLEQGLAQLYNPDELAVAQTTSADMRVGCRGNTEEEEAPLTSDQALEHMRAAVKFILRCLNIANAALHLHGLTWSQRDTLRLAKLEHALPGLISQGFTQAAAAKQASSWDTFVAILPQLVLPEGVQRYHPYTAELRNAEEVGGL